MKTTLILVYGISAALFLSGSAHAADGARSGQLTNPDKRFVEDAIAGGQTEVQLGQLASQKAENQGVRDFGTRMAQDHAKVNEQLTRILALQGITEAPPTSRTTRMADQLQNASGGNFDRDYMNDMVKDHKKDIASFKNEAANGKDSEIRSWAAETLPVLEEHLQLAEQVQSSLPK